MPGAGSQLVERDDGSGTRIDDLATYAEILQHAFQCRRIAVDDVARQRRALAGALCGQKIERGQGIAVGAAT